MNDVSNYEKSDAPKPYDEWGPVNTFTLILSSLAAIAFFIFRFNPAWLLGVMIIADVLPFLIQAKRSSTNKSKGERVGYWIGYLLCTIGYPVILIYIFLVPTMEKGLLSASGILLGVLVILTLFYRYRRWGLRGIQKSISIIVLTILLLLQPLFRSLQGMGNYSLYAAIIVVIVFGVVDYIEGVAKKKENLK